MASSAASTRRLTSSSSPIASTPPVTTTTTTTTTTTGTLSASDPRQQRQSTSSQSPMVAPTNISTSNDAPVPLYSEDGELPEEVLSYFEHWASPTEVLQLRALCGDVVNKYKNETAKLLRELEEVKRGRDALQREAQETQRLRELYSKAEAEYEKARKERSQWSEERELLRLRLQRLSVENQRLQQIVASWGRNLNTNQLRGRTAASPLSLGDGSGAAFTSTTTPLFTGSSIPTPSASSSSAARQTHGGCATQQRRQQRQQQQPQHPVERDAASGGNYSSGMGGDDYYYSSSQNNSSSSSSDINMALREQLRLIEEIHRCSTEYAELDARFHFAQSLWDITATRGEQRSMLLVAENEKLKDQLRHWRSVAEDNAGRLDTTKVQLRDRCNDVEEARRALQVAHAERQTAVAAERSAAEESMSSIRAAHAEELARVQQQLQVALDDSSRTRDKLQGALDAAQRGADAQREELLADVGAAEQKYADALRKQQELETTLAEATSQHERQQEQMERELRLLRSAQETAVKKRDEQSAVLEKTLDENTGLTARLLEAEEELRTVSARLNVALEKLQHAGELEEALVSARARAEELELEVQTQQSYYAEQLRMHERALGELQKQRDDEVRRLGRTVERLQRRYASNKLRLAAAVKGIGRAADAGSISPPPMTCGKEEQAAAQSSTVRTFPLAEETTGPDAVLLLQQSTAIVAALARTLNRGTHAA
ncbi:hypothetical protein MOQ_007732 [Trypanosoma cruzi marinkellei]|uniref:Uncharacterized protein n=1 Tax=Trypanosoma cruzi marinkellei TaxID=85056 RepID=K2M0R6_TRYCR|nr:hypothetical protein MOQ_007732 [Trypanosoma cruzi marinkellei]